MSMDAQGEFNIDSEADIAMARKLVRQAAVAVGFGITDTTRIVTSASELVRNICLYAGKGRMRWHSFQQGNADCLELVFEDQGPGIADISQAMRPGFTTSKGLGLGLPGAKRLMDEMEIESELGKGTTIRIKKWLRK
jgi:serine/threonine-protein kinase RsbT